MPIEKPGEYQLTTNECKRRLQENEYAIPYHYQDLFAPAQAVERISLFRSILVNFVGNTVSHTQPPKLIDIGCGDGRFCYFAKQYLDIDGLDVSEKALHWARAFNPDVTFHNCDIQHLQANYSGAVCLEVLEHIPDNEIPDFLSAIENIVSPDGKVIFTVPSVNAPLIEKHFRHYHGQLLLETLRPYFKKIRIVGYGRIAPYHRKVFSFLNIISLLFYSQEFCWRFPKFVSTLTHAKYRYWAQYLHTGNPENCYRMAAICSTSLLSGARTVYTILDP